MDVDIDFPTDFDPLDVFPQLVTASIMKNGKIKKHQVGKYLQEMPTDPVTGYAAIPYDRSEDFGFYKIDFLHLSVLDHFESKQEMKVLMDTPPDWRLLHHPDVVEKLFQLHRHYKLLHNIGPTSIVELADCVAMIRPNKRHLQIEYRGNEEEVRKELYRRDRNDKTTFKRGHSIAYAIYIVLQLHLINAGVI